MWQWFSSKGSLHSFRFAWALISNDELLFLYGFVSESSIELPTSMIKRAAGETPPSLYSSRTGPNLFLGYYRNQVAGLVPRREECWQADQHAAASWETPSQ